MRFEFIDGIATADVAFRAWGRNLEDVFEAAAAATMNVMVEDLKGIERRESRQVELRDQREEMLLFDFLQELIFYKDAEGLLLLPEEIKIEDEHAGKRLRARLSGERLDLDRHSLQVDVKAVTMHRFALRQTEDGWESEVVLDI